MSNEVDPKYAASKQALEQELAALVDTAPLSISEVADRLQEIVTSYACNKS